MLENGNYFDVKNQNNQYKYKGRCIYRKSTGEIVLQ